MKKITALLCVLLCVVWCTACESSQKQSRLAKLPPPERDGSPFGIDVNINMTTIDNWLERPDVAYFDLRMFRDPAEFCALGQPADLTRTLPGFRIIPFPYLAYLGPMPVAEAYDGDRLFEVVWGTDYRGQILEITPNYLESEIILNDIFPKDKAIFLMCGGAGYSALTRGLLIHMGWDENLIYLVGGNWFYEGNRGIDMAVSGDNPEIATWRVNHIFIDFEYLEPVD